jgi:hypothetical protein
MLLRLITHERPTGGIVNKEKKNNMDGRNRNTYQESKVF